MRPGARRIGASLDAVGSLRLQSAAEERGKNVADIERVLSYPAAARELQKYNLDADQVRAAVATLSGLIVVILVVVHFVAGLDLSPHGGVEDARPVPQIAPVNGWKLQASNRAGLRLQPRVVK
jgi:hypothetical protein